MFVLNGEKLTKDSFPEAYKWMEEKKNELRAFSKERNDDDFKFSTNKVTILKTDKGPQKAKQRTSVPVVTNFYNEELNQHQTWTYVSHASAIRSTSSGIEIDPQATTGIVIDGSISYNVNSDIDLIFFFKYCSQLVKKGRIVFVDKTKSDREKAERQMEMSKAMSLIFDLDSPISTEVTGGAGVLKNIAIAWGVAITDSMDIATIKNDLWTRVQNAEKTRDRSKRGYKEFILEAKRHGNVEMRADVEIGINKGVIVFDSPMWMLNAHNEENIPISYCNHEEINGTEEIRKERLIKSLTESRSSYDLLVATLKQDAGKRIVEESGKTRQGMVSELNKLKKEKPDDVSIPSYQEMMKMPEAQIADLYKRYF